MIHMPETANCVVPFSRIYRGCSRGKNVDIVGVTSSILVTPTILLPLFPKRCAVLVAAFTYFSTGSLNLKTRRFNA